MSISLLPILQAIDVVNTPTVPHLGVVVRLKRSAKQVSTRSLVIPKELPTPPAECVDGGKALSWYKDHEAPVPTLREHIAACAAYGDFHNEHAAQEAVIDISHQFRRRAHTLEYSHCQASDHPHVGCMGRGGAANIAVNTFHGACIKVPYLTSGPVAHATGLVGQWTIMQNCIQFLLVMHRMG